MKQKTILAMTALVVGAWAMPALALDNAAKVRLAAVDKVSGYDAVLAQFAPADLAAALVYLVDVKKLSLADVVQLGNAAIAKKPVADQPKYVAAVKAALSGLAIDDKGQLIVQAADAAPKAAAGVVNASPAAGGAAPSSPTPTSGFINWTNGIRGGNGNGQIFDNPKGVSR
jgi:hypothetical protein